MQLKAYGLTYDICHNVVVRARFDDDSEITMKLSELVELKESPRSDDERLRILVANRPLVNSLMEAAPPPPDIAEPPLQPLPGNTAPTDSALVSRASDC